MSESGESMLDLAVRTRIFVLRRYHSAGAFRVGLQFGTALAEKRGLSFFGGRSERWVLATVNLPDISR
jgi:hypothetical protein